MEGMDWVRSRVSSIFHSVIAARDKWETLNDRGKDQLSSYVNCVLKLQYQRI